MRILLLFSILSCFYPLFSQIGNRYIRNYSTLEYKAAKQNWYATQNEQGLIYFANEFGVLEYDGASWNLIKTPGSVYAIKCAEDQRIYTGGVNQMGYIIPDKFGKMQYRSLNAYLSEEYKPYDYIFDIYEADGKIYFSTKGGIFIWNRDHFEVIPSKGEFHVMFKISAHDIFLYP